MKPGQSKVQNKGFGSSGHTFGEEGKKKRVPGPGAYGQSSDEYDYNKVGFGSSTRDSKSKSFGVGPG